jgi:ornithine decarboxylase
MVGLGGDVISQLLLSKNPEDSFYIMNLKHLNTAYEEWTRAFPTIRPFYAVKCNPDRHIVERLASLGAGFDCASPGEIDLVLDCGVHPSNIIYANPVKRIFDLQYARNLGVTTTTLDSIEELEKIQRHCPDMEVILRIKASDPTAKCVLSNKYGAELKDCAEIIQKAGSKLVGVSFHVGSGARDPTAYRRAIREAMAIVKDKKLKILDIGGGFTYGELPVSDIQEAIEGLEGLTIIAEPGRYFAENVGTLVSPVIGKKVTQDETQYYISDSLYGSFNCIVYDHAKPEIKTFNTGPTRKSRVFGSTCDGLDEIISSVDLPDLQVNDWTIFERMGAYTTAASTNFNGIPFTTRIRYYIDT